MKSKFIKSSSVLTIGIALLVAFILASFLAGCNQNSQQKSNDNEPIVGQWETSYISTDQPGKKVFAIFSIKEDGNAYWITLADTIGYQITNITLDTWEKEGNNIYAFSDTSENIYKYQYNKDTDTVISSDSELILTRLDPIVGIWTGVAAEEVGSGNCTILFKSDGTAISTVAFENGTADVYNLTWKKTSNYDYDIFSGDRQIRTYTVSDDGYYITTDDNRSKTKCFTDSTFLVSITGAWYCPDKNYSVVFNSDGTGFANYNGQEVYDLSWKILKKGFEVTFKDGVDKNGNVVEGKTYTWTYNKDNNFITSSVGTKYIRPTSSIPGLITFK